MPVADELDGLIAYEIGDKAIPSISYALFDANGILEQRHVVRSGALADNALFRIGSISKTFAAVAALQLVEAGRLDLDADIARYLPGFAPIDPWHGGPVTLRKLLGHRAGLTREAAAGHYLDDRPVLLAETVAGLGRSRLKAPGDGSSYFYSNAGYAVVGATVEAAAGIPYAEHLHAAIFAPLGLTDTGIALTPGIRARLAPALMWTADADFPAPVFDLGGAAAGNIVASLRDVARWGRMLLRGGEGLISPATLAAMWTPGGTDPAKGYGLGFAIDQLDGRRSVGHGGVVYGYASSLLLLPDAGLGIVMLSTLDFTNELIGRLARRALRLALAGRGEGPRPRPARRLPPPGVTLAAELAGTYRAEDGQFIELRASGLRLTLVEDGVPIEIRPIGQGRFVLDGRIFGEETAHPAPLLEVLGTTLGWQGRRWRRLDGPVAEPIPAELAPHLGTYGPAFMPVDLQWSGGRLLCLLEYFAPHRCEPLGDDRFVLHGGLYEREILELGILDPEGRPAIRVGEMVLAKRGA